MTGPTFAEETQRELSAVDRPEAVATRLQVLPEIDGVVRSDVAWAELPIYTLDYQNKPRADVPPTQKTEVRIGFSEEHLYVGVTCYETDPSKIVISNDGWNSDGFLVILDPFRSGLNGFVFATSPHGAEWDGQLADLGSDWNWSTTWHVEATIHDVGWSAEMEIPFQSLRYGNAPVQTWGFNLERYIARDQEVAVWAPIPLQFGAFRLDLAGTISGIEVPPMHRNLEITPYVVGGRVSATDEDTEETDAGVDLKYSLTPGLTLDLTYNTDFAQIESDRIQINFSRFGLFFPETRPFFQENAALFRVGVPRRLEMFHSRRIGIADDGSPIPIRGGARVSGKIGAQTNLAALHMITDPSSEEFSENEEFTILRMRRDYQNRSNVGFIATNRDGGQGSARTFAVDGDRGFGENKLLRGFVATTHRPGDNSDNYAIGAYFDHSGEVWSLSGALREVGDNFDPQVGFASRTGFRSFHMSSSKRHILEPQSFYGANHWYPFFATTHFWDFDGNWESGNVHLETWWTWSEGGSFWAAIDTEHELVKYPFYIGENQVKAGEYDWVTGTVSLGTAPQRKWSVNANVTAGGFYSGTGWNGGLFVAYRPGEKFNWLWSLAYTDIDLEEENAFSVVNAGTGFVYSFSPKISLSTNIQYSDISDTLIGNLRFRLQRTANSGFYFIVNHATTGEGAYTYESSGAFVKYSHIFDMN